MDAPSSTARVGHSPRLGILATHPIQYHAPLYRQLSRDPRIALKVYYCHHHGVEATFDPGFGQAVRFDVPLLEGYAHEFLPNIHPQPRIAASALVNPAITRVLLGGECDALLVHGYSYLTAIMAFFGPHGATKLMLRGDSHARRSRPLPIRLAKSLYLRSLIQRADHFLAIGKLNAQYYSAYGARPEQITFAPYSVDSELFSSRTQTRSAQRRDLGLPERGPLVLYVGRLAPDKRPLDLVRAFARVPEALGMTLAIVGSGELQPQLTAEIARLGLSARAHLLGFKNQSELPSVYQCADVLVLPSEHEPWGLVVNEAMSAGVLPVVTDQVGCGPDLVADEFIYPAADVAALSSILTRLAQDPKRLDQLRREARTRIASWSLVETSDAFVRATYLALGRALPSLRDAAETAQPPLDSLRGSGDF